METQQLSIKTAFENEDVRKKFFEMLGHKATGFMVSVINIVSSSADLSMADRDSILFAAATAAAMDLPINPNLGFAYIVAYNSKNGVKAQFQMGYKGFIQLAQRSGQFKTISACPIYKGQLISNDPLRGIEFDFTKKESDEIIGFAGFFALLNGFEKTLFMTVEEMKAHGLKYSQSYKSNKQWVKESSRWTTHFESMGCKTVIKLLLSKYAPLSIEMQKAVLTDQSVIGDWDGNNLNYPDNEKEPNNAAKQKEVERIKKHIENATSIEKLEEAYEYVADLEDSNELKILYSSKYKELFEKEVKEGE